MNVLEQLESGIAKANKNVDKYRLDTSPAGCLAFDKAMKLRRGLQAAKAKMKARGSLSSWV